MAIDKVTGVVSMCGGFVKNYSALIGIRVLLGIVEGGLLPGIVSYSHSFSYSFAKRVMTYTSSLDLIPVDNLQP